jgi:hypothetical protein
MDILVTLRGTPNEYVVGTIKKTKALQTAAKSKGMTVFAHIDHAAGAAEVGMTLRPGRIRTSAS